MSKQNRANSFILNSLTQYIVSADVNYTRVQTYIIFFTLYFLFSFQGQYHTGTVKRTTRRGQVCTGLSFLHINFSLRADIHREIFRICYVKRGFLYSRYHSAWSFTNVYLQTFRHGNFSVAVLVCIIRSTIAMQQTKEWQEVVPQTGSKNDTKAKDTPALHLQYMCLVA